jgi:hypothetical protein
MKFFLFAIVAATAYGGTIRDNGCTYVPGENNMATLMMSDSGAAAFMSQTRLNSNEIIVSPYDGSMPYFISVVSEKICNGFYFYNVDNDDIIIRDMNRCGISAIFNCGNFKEDFKR